jgi:hypothetical protein
MLSEQDKVAVYTELSTLAQDFIHCVHTYGKIIISEIYTETENKTVKPMSNMGFAGRNIRTHTPSISLLLLLSFYFLTCWCVGVCVFFSFKVVISIL